MIVRTLLSITPLQVQSHLLDIRLSREIHSQSSISDRLHMYEMKRYFRNPNIQGKPDLHFLKFHIFQFLGFPKKAKNSFLLAIRLFMRDVNKNEFIEINPKPKYKEFIETSRLDYAKNLLQEGNSLASYDRQALTDYIKAVE